MLNKNAKTALILDDHVIIRNSCRALLEQENFLVVWEGDDGDLAYDAYTKEHPSICIIDLSLGKTNGLQTIEKIVTFDPSAKIVIFSMYNDSMFISRALQIGASGYVTKHSQPSHLINAVKSALNGKSYLSNDIDNTNLTHNAAQNISLFSRLTNQEKNVFMLSVRGMNSTTIANQLSISTKSVSHHLSSIKQKLDARNISDLIKIALCYGLDINDKKIL